MRGIYKVGMKFEFFGNFFRFFGASKMTSFSIQMVKFEFKWTNHKSATALLPTGSNDGQ
jgi:hypothetical protein